MTEGMKEINVHGLDVKVWMMRHGLTGRDIAQGYGCVDMVVSNFIRGKRTSKGLAAYFINKGCPEKYFKNGRVIV